MSDAPKPPPELTSILSQVQILQNDRERLMRELEDANGRVDKLQVRHGSQLAWTCDLLGNCWGIARELLGNRQGLARESPGNC